MSSYADQMDMFYRTLIAMFSLTIVALISGLLVDSGYTTEAYVLLAIGGIAAISYQVSAHFRSLSPDIPAFLRPNQTPTDYRQQGLDTARADGDRPYEHLDDETLKQEYKDAVSTVRNADEGGFHLSPTIDRGSLLREEWVERGNDVTELSRTDTSRETGGN